MRPRIPAVLTLAATLASAACSRDPQAAAPVANGVPVRTAAVERRDLDDTLVLTGTLRPRAQVQVVAEVAARLLAVEHDEGARVATGDVLARLDETDYRLARDRAKAMLAVAEANRQHALAEKERADNLLKTGGVTDKDHLAAQVGLSVGEASLAQARAEAEIAATQLGRCQVKAPFAGRVAKRSADPGAMLAAGTPIFTLVDDSVLEFRASVPSASYGAARVGETAEITVDAFPGYAAHGRVARIAPLVDERNRSFEVVVEVAGDRRLVGGMFARAVLSTGHVPGALVVPPTALIRDGARADAAEVFVVVAGKAERRKLTLGAETADAIQVKDGLSEGEQVVLDPPASLGSGASVIAQNGRKK
jgi:RND family efflux transporter MFP subunit